MPVPKFNTGHDNWSTLKMPGGTIPKHNRFDYGREHLRRQALSPGPMTANMTSYIKGAIQLPKIRNNSISKEALMSLPNDDFQLQSNRILNNNNSKTSLFSKGVT